jgi:hypothetical protein
MMIEAMIDDEHASFESESDRDAHVARYGMLQQGRLLPRTERGVPGAVVLRLNAPKGKGSRLYLYDASGEEYSTAERLPREECVFFRDLSGLILLVDPSCLPRLRQQLDASDPSLGHVSHGSETPFEDVVASLCRNVRKFLNRWRSRRTSVPLAVVINKADITEVRQRLDVEAVRKTDGEETCVSGKPEKSLNL